MLGAVGNVGGPFLFSPVPPFPGLEWLRAASYISGGTLIMSRTMRSSRLSRREFAFGAAAVAVAAMPVTGAAQDQPQAWEQAVKKLLGDAKPIEGKLVVDLPEIAENGNTVPFTIAIDSPMTEADHVKAIHL